MSQPDPDPNRDSSDLDGTLQLILDGIEQLASRMSDVREQCSALAHRLDRLGQRLDEIERRRDEEMLLRIEREPSRA